MATKKLMTTTKVLGEMKTSEVIQYMQAVGDPRVPKVKRALRQTGKDVQFNKLKLPNLGDWITGGKSTAKKDKDLAWRITEHQYGYFGIDTPNSPDILDITDAGYVTADETLKNQPLFITLDRLRVYDYPGGGTHTVLVEFSALHVLPETKESLKYTQKYEASEGSGAAVRGYPIFVGILAGTEGIALEGRTVNVGNAGDQGILAFLDNQVFKQGLELLNKVNPVLPVVTSFATGITEVFAKRNENQPVQKFNVGLGFSSVASRARLREGTYIIAQAADKNWDWSQWQYTRSTGKLTKKGSKKLIPYNYLVIGVSRMEPKTV